jgi:hypothetical protein
MRTSPTIPNHGAKIIQDALDIEGDDAVNCCFPKTWPADREQRARIIGEWLETESTVFGLRPAQEPPAGTGRSSARGAKNT